MYNPYINSAQELKICLFILAINGEKSGKNILVAVWHADIFG